MFYHKKTKWVQILIYDFSSNKYLLESRMNLKNGKLYFRNTRINTYSNLLHNSVICNIFDPKIQFEKLLCANPS